MPSFDLRFITKPEDIPGCLVSVDARTGPDVALSSGNVASVLNRAPDSLRARNRRDSSIAPWWDAVSETGGALPFPDPTAFGNAGGIVMPATSDFILTSQTPFPAIAAGEYSAFFIVGYTPGAPALVFEDGAGLEIKLEDGGGNLAYVDFGGSKVGPSTIAGSQYHSLQLGKASALASPTGVWRRNGIPAFSAAYSPTDFSGVGTNTRIFGGPIDFDGTVGRMLFYTRRLTDIEVDFLECTVPQGFSVGSSLSAFAPGVRPYVSPASLVWTDPAGGPGQITRTNAVSGISERYLKVKHIANQTVSLLVVPTIGEALDASTDFAGWFVEWPLQGTEPEPTIIQDGYQSGVCRLDLKLDGHYLFQLWRPGGGAVLVHFDVSTF